MEITSWNSSRGREQTEGRYCRPIDTPSFKSWVFNLAHKIFKYRGYCYNNVVLSVLQILPGRGFPALFRDTIMKFSAQEEYGLRCILSLARAENQSGISAAPPSGNQKRGAFLTVGEVAETEGISSPYVRKLLSILAKADLVQSVRGCKGGYQLAREAASITIAEVLQVLGGRFYESDTCSKFVGVKKFCVHNNQCSIRSLWSGLQHILDGVLEKVTLQELTGNEESMSNWIQIHSSDVRKLVLPGKIEQKA